jgi:hypothetical protein
MQRPLTNGFRITSWEWLVWSRAVSLRKENAVLDVYSRRSVRHGLQRQSAPRPLTLGGKLSLLHTNNMAVALVHVTGDRDGAWARRLRGRGLKANAYKGAE